MTGRYSTVLQKHACRLAADVSFVKASEHLREMLGVRVAPETVRVLVESHGRAMATFQPTDGATATRFQGAKGEVEVAIDAGKVHTREGGWRDRKIAVLSRREAGDPAPPIGWADEDRLPAASVVVAFAMIATARVFRRCGRYAVRPLGVSTFATVHAPGDGAGWIWKGVDRALTGCTQTRDIDHACEKLGGCAKRIFGDGTAAAGAGRERGRERLLGSGWAGVCPWVAELLAVEDPEERERRRKYTEKRIGYSNKHLGRLNDAERLASGRVIGSGAVEGQAKTLGLRLKSRGARWCEPNVRPMASLVCVRNSVQWEAYWAQAA
ncbi:MAG TPA: hypothetical protein VH092_07700 [Urbifossiella sp.]|nr:hypothetical protein [Urbifossiella sp.]